MKTEQLHSGAAAGLRQLLPPWPIFAGFVALALFMLMEVFSYASFGPELAYFYEINAKLTFRDVLHTYLEFDQSWYRPSAFYTPYFFVSKLFGWHHLVIWKAATFFTLLATCWALYAFTLLLFPRQHLGAFLACVYLAGHPAVYLPLFEISAFDFLYLFFVLAAVIGFLLAWRERGTRALLYNSAAVLSYVLALTSKESSILTPFYLAAASAVLLYAGRAEGPAAPRIRKAARLLAPHFAVFALYVALHVAQMPTRPVDADYRTQPNLTRMLVNSTKYPLWMAHLFQGNESVLTYVYEQATIENNLFGYTVLALALFQWTVDTRKRIHRAEGILLVLWIPIFLAVPIYAGAYLWHINLALCGYAVFAGVALARLAARLSQWQCRIAVASLLFVCLVLTRKDVHHALYFGIHSPAFRINNASLFVHPPVPREKMGTAPYILIENPQNLHGWYFGSGNLFALVYDLPDARQTEAPPLNQVPPERCLDWLRRKQAFFFRYDENYRWHDATAEFTRHALAQIAPYSEKLLAEHRNKELAAALAPVAARHPENAEIQRYYQRALGR
ncbi:MAG TPA: hypothetical protein VG672_11030 [Bryobacteraceae bacterium]|jgi:hypothetical protein|nr:hypothetical protein [Bryobacteraceae bacterium]